MEETVQLTITGYGKGRFGFDYIHNLERITKPLIRKEGV